MTDPRPRDLIGHGRTRPHAAWSGQARVTVSFVLNMGPPCPETAGKRWSR